MKQKPALLLSIFISTFLLTTVAGAISLTGGTARAANSKEELQAALQGADYETAYNQLVAEANQRLADAQAVIDSLQVNAANDSQSALVGLSGQEAADIAAQWAQGSNIPVGEAELVDFEGQVAYEVVFPGGNIYIDAETGDLIFNGTITIIPPDISAERAEQLATAYLGDNDVYKVEPLELEGQLVYRVKFSAGHAVFVSIKGEILLVRLADTIQGGNNSSSGSSYSDDHEEHEEHEEESEHYDD